MRSRALIALTALGAAVVSGGWLLQRGLDRGEVGLQRARLFDAVATHVRNDFVDSLSESKLYQMALDGMMGQLGDPYSTFLTPERFGRLTESTSGNYGGLGIQIDSREGWITVIAPMPGTPAERAGVQTGDRIMEIDGRSTKGLNPDEGLKALRGTPGSAVKLSVERPGVPGRLPFTLTRAEIHSRAVQQHLMLDSAVGYVDLNVFSDSTSLEVGRAVDDLRRRGMKTMVLDLRGNPGGLLEEGVDVSDLFLDPGQRIVSMRGRAAGTTREYLDQRAQAWGDLPLIVLINGGSASASEIVAGALQDHDRALLLGQRSFGKGSAQSVWRMPDGAALKLTTARWFTPAGRSIQKRAPAAGAAADEDDDSEEPGDSAEARRPIFRTEGGRVVTGGGGISPDVEVAPPEADSAALRFQRALGNALPAFRDVLTDYAISFRASHAVASPDFAVAPAMKEELWRRMRARGIAVDRSAYDAADVTVSRLLGLEITRYAFGPEAEFLRRTRLDPVIAAALELARGGGTQRDLLARGAARGPRER